MAQKNHPTPSRLAPPPAPTVYEGPIHALYYSERRRADLLLCGINRSTDQFAQPWDSTKDEAEVTCARCLTLLREGAHRWDDEHGRWVPR